MRIELILLLLGIVCLVLGALLAWWYFTLPRLNLTIEGPKMLNIGQTATATIAPTAAGVPDANVSAVVFSVVPVGAYTIVPGPTPFSAVYTAAVVGVGIVANVSAVNEAGVTLTDSQPLPAVGTLVADKLNLTITTP